MTATPDADAHVARITIDHVDMVLPATFVGSTYRHSSRSTFVTTVELSDGTTAVAVSGHGHGDPPRVARWAQRFADRGIGRSLSEAADIWDELYGIASATSVLEFPYAMAGLAVVDIALWHARGVVADVPLCQLLGADPTPIPALLVGGYYDGDTEREATGLVDAAVDTGVAAVKLKVGGAAPSDDLVKVDALRRRIADGDDLAVVYDANRAWDVATAGALLAELGARGPVEWVEEPLRGDLEWRGARRLREQFGVPIGSGQSTTTPDAAAALIAAGAVDVVNADASWIGGVTGWLRVRDDALDAGVRIAHHVEPHLSMHLLATVPPTHEVGFVEVYMPDRDPVWHSMIDAPAVVDGCITAPDAPGLGVDVDLGFVNRHRR